MPGHARPEHAAHGADAGAGRRQGCGALGGAAAGDKGPDGGVPRGAGGAGQGARVRPAGEAERRGSARRDPWPARGAGPRGRGAPLAGGAHQPPDAEGELGDLRQDELPSGTGAAARAERGSGLRGSAGAGAAGAPCAGPAGGPGRRKGGPGAAGPGRARGGAEDAGAARGARFSAGGFRGASHKDQRGPRTGPGATRGAHRGAEAHAHKHVADAAVRKPAVGARRAAAVEGSAGGYSPHLAGGAKAASR
mmetsp:Transcript_55827/g.154569  ORF Transcript_55827/g.154569 Transcript_55827/m.154569 type:complete len:250 (-) Transcript_55827:633-1382(-)